MQSLMSFSSAPFDNLTVGPGPLENWHVSSGRLRVDDTFYVRTGIVQTCSSTLTRAGRQEDSLVSSPFLPEPERPRDKRSDSPPTASTSNDTTGVQVSETQRNPPRTDPVVTYRKGWVTLLSHLPSSSLGKRGTFP